MLRAIVLLLFLLPTPVWATTRYMSTLGNDSNTCATSQAPGAKAKRTFNGTGGAIQCMVGGDTLLVEDGAWPEQISDTPSEAPGSKRPPSGLSWDQPTVIRAVNPRKATLNKPSPEANYVVFLANPTTQYVSIEGLVLDGRGHGDCVWMGPSSHLQITGGVIKNCGGNGIYGSVDDQDQGGSDHRITYNEIFNFALDHPGPPGMHGIYHTGNHSRIAHNFVHEPCPFYGIHLTSEHGGLHDNVIENNRVRGCHQQGIVNQGSRTVIRNNLLENNGIGISCNGSAEQAVLHNTIYGWHPSPFNADNYGILDMTGGCVIAHNLILKQDDVSYLRRYIYATVGTPQLSGNMCDAVHPQNCQMNVPPGSVVVRDGAAGDLRLTEGSAALDRVPPLAAVPTDYVSVARPQGSAADIGAYEGTGGVRPIDPPPTSGADTTPPTVALTAPTPGASLTGVVTLTATAADNVGIAGLQFKADGKNIGPEQAAAPYSYAWDTATTTPGTHTLAASVRDAAGNFATSVSVIVSVVPGAAGLPRPPASSALTCTGTINAVPGQITMECQPVTGKR